jgi:hypothetical protein
MRRQPVRTAREPAPDASRFLAVMPAEPICPKGRTTAGLAVSLDDVLTSRSRKDGGVSAPELGDQCREGTMPRQQLECARAASDRSANEPVAKRGSKMSRRGALFALAGVAALLSGLVAAPAPAQQGADTSDWIGTWAASPQPVWDVDFFAPVGIPRARCATRPCGRSRASASAAAASAW